MSIPPLLLQFGGSLIAIFALYTLARTLKLGGRPKFESEESVRFAAGEVEDGFIAERVAVAREGNAALTSDTDGKIMLIKRHGNQFAGRVLTSRAHVHEEVDSIVVDCGDKRFGKVRLSIEQPGIWVDAINRL
ncbi:hypothetical protein [uncultured Erythrobacter sp.]|uniref:hypothetical protein n=1 Tax=uncultured Erythrobacter sp. TaxID=263913 RepID=UPI002601A392|nr:hypothetical protein [uncultured Erythrobacter sp.]